LGGIYLVSYKKRALLLRNDVLLKQGHKSLYIEYNLLIVAEVNLV